MQWPPTNPGKNFKKFHSGACRLQHLFGVDLHAIEDDGKLIHERNVQVALGVFDDLGGLPQL